MGLIELVLLLAIVGFLVWLITTKIPMDNTVKIAIQVIVVVVVVIYVLRVLGFHDIPIK
jgi:hypothetical protein